VKMEVTGRCTSTAADVYDGAVLHARSSGRSVAALTTDFIQIMFPNHFQNLTNSSPVHNLR